MVEKILGKSMFVNEENVEMKDTLYSVFEKIKFSNTKEILSFTEFEAEYNALVHGVGLTIHNAGILKISGKDALDYLHRISTNDLINLSDEKYKATLFLNDRGKIIDRANVLHFGDDLLTVSSKHHKDKLVHWLRKYIITEDVNLEDVSDQYFLVNVFGPQALGFVTLYYADRTDEFNQHKYVLDSIEGIDSILYKDYLNNYYFFSILINSKNLLSFCKFIRESHSVFDVRFAGKEAFHIFRIERGLPFYPNEINDEFNPYDLNLITDVSFNKGCYIGQEIVARLDTYPKAKRNLSGICFEGELPESPFEIFNEQNEAVGLITSCVNSKLLDKPIGIGPIKVEILNTKTEVKLSDGRDAKIESLPFKI